MSKTVAPLKMDKANDNSFPTFTTLSTYLQMKSPVRKWTMFHRRDSELFKLKAFLCDKVVQQCQWQLRPSPLNQSRVLIKIEIFFYVILKNNIEYTISSNMATIATQTISDTQTLAWNGGKMQQVIQFDKKKGLYLKEFSFTSEKSERAFKTGPGL